jgi:hypothetical protein
MDELNELQSLGFSLPSPAYILGVILFSCIGFVAYRSGKKSVRPRVYVRRRTTIGGNRGNPISGRGARDLASNPQARKPCCRIAAARCGAEGNLMNRVKALVRAIGKESSRRESTVVGAHANGLTCINVR